MRQTKGLQNKDHQGNEDNNHWRWTYVSKKHKGCHLEEPRPQLHPRDIWPNNR